jgi:protein SCO1/2
LILMTIGTGVSCGSSIARTSTIELSTSYRSHQSKEIRKRQGARLEIASPRLPPGKGVVAAIQVPCKASSLFHILLILILFSLISARSVLGQTPHASQPIGITQKIGQAVPARLVFADEQGREVMLGNLIRVPAILTLVYYDCCRFCPQMLAGLAAVLPQLDLSPGKDYQVITVSFDENDSPVRARDVRRDYLKAIGSPFPDDAWRFLTGDRENLGQLCDAAGFSFRKEMHGFAHPVALIILSPNRKISRYIHISKFSYGVAYPITFSAIELSHALADASQEKLGEPTKKEFLYCFPHEPQGQQRFFNILTAAGAITIVCLVLLFVYLSLTGRKPREGKRS